MPCLQCDNGKWKFGKTGECKYTSKETCEADNASYYAETYNDYPESASNNACKVLKWREEHGDEVKGMTRVGWNRANQLCSKEKLSRRTIARMASFKRHEKNAEVSEENKATPWKDAGYVAWLGWGGTSGVNWAIKKLESIDKKKNDASHDLHIDLTNEMMEQLHDTGELETLVEEDGKEMFVKITFGREDINDIINASNYFTRKYKNYLEKYGYKRT